MLVIVITIIIRTSNRVILKLLRAPLKRRPAGRGASTIQYSVVV